MHRLWHLLGRLRWYRLANALALSHNAKYCDLVHEYLRHPLQTGDAYQCFWSGLCTHVPVGWWTPVADLWPDIDKTTSEECDLVFWPEFYLHPGVG